MNEITLSAQVSHDWKISIALINSPLNWIFKGSGNVLSHASYQAISRANANLFIIRNKFQCSFYHNTGNFIQ